MENEDQLFNIDFNSISDETIEISDIMSEETPQVDDTVLEDSDGDETPVNEQDAEQEEEKKEKKDKKEKSEEPQAETIEIEDAEEEEKTSEKEKNPGDEGESSSPVTPFATLLHERGFLPNYDPEAFAEAVKESDDPFDVLAQAMKYELDMANASFINSFPPELVDMAKAVAAGVPFDALKGPKLQQINYEKLEDNSIKENEDLQKKLVTDYYSSKGFSDTKITKLIETLGDSGTLEEEALEARSELSEAAKVEQEEIKKKHAAQQKRFEEQHTAQIQYIGQTIDGIDEIIPGVKMTKNVKDRLFQNMTEMVGKDPNGNPINFTMALRQQNPVSFDLAVTYLADITKGFSDWSKLGKAAKSNATAELEKTLSKSSLETPPTGSPKKGPRSEEAEDSLMESLNSMFNK